MCYVISVVGLRVIGNAILTIKNQDKSLLPHSHPPPHHPKAHPHPQPHSQYTRIKN